MRAAPPARIALALAGAAVALWAGRLETIAALGIVVAAFLLLGEAGALGRLLGVLAPLVVTTAALWLFLDYPPGAGFARAAGALVASNAPFLKFMRSLAGGLTVALALGVAPDGEFYALARRAGAPHPAAVLLSGAAAVSTQVAESFVRADTALRAQGFVGHGVIGRVRGLAAIAATTWVSGLSLALERADCAWTGNGLLARLASDAPQPGEVGRSATAVVSLAAFAMMVVLVGGRCVAHRL